MFISITVLLRHVRGEIGMKSLKYLLLNTISISILLAGCGTGKKKEVERVQEQDPTETHSERNTENEKDKNKEIRELSPLNATISNKDNIPDQIEDNSLIFNIKLTNVPDLTIYEVLCKFSKDEDIDSTSWIRCNRKDRHTVSGFKRGIKYTFKVNTRNLINQEMGQEDSVSFELPIITSTLTILGENELINRTFGSVDLQFVAIDYPDATFNCTINETTTLPGCEDGFFTLDYSSLEEGPQTLTVTAFDFQTGDQIALRSVDFEVIEPRGKKCKRRGKWKWKSCCCKH